MFRKPAFLSVIVLLLASALHADGKYWPERAIAAEPSIPLQRALITYRDGSETLIVESTFDSPSPSVGWVLPLPSQPTKLEVADPGLLRTLDFCLQPSITHDMSLPSWTTFLWLSVIILPIPLAVIFVRNPGYRKNIYTTVLLLFFLSGLFLPSLSKAGLSLSGGPSVDVLSTQRVGSYNASVLRAKSPDDLSQWLSDNSLKPLDEPSAAVVGDYIKSGWCFLVAQLRHDPAGPATPHPISATFPTSSPVYPMKLTALAGSTTRVELFIVADEMARAEGFHAASADQYDLSHSSYNDPPSPYYHSRAYYFRIGHPDLMALMWENCILTRLSADLAPSQMSHDVILSLNDLTPHRNHVYSPRGRRELVLWILLLSAFPLIIFVTVIFRQRRRPRPWELKTLVGLLAAILLFAAYRYATAEVIPVQPLKRGDFFRQYDSARHLSLAATAMVADGLLHSGMTPAELTQLPQLALEKKYLTGLFYNPFTGGPITFERSPGNLSTRKINDVTYLCFYDRVGSEYRVELPPPPANAPQPPAKPPDHPLP